MRIVANGLTAFRLLAAFALFGLILNAQWQTATVLFILATLSDAFDGEIVRRFGLPQNPRGDMYDQIADGQLTLWVMLGLIITGHMPWCVGMVALVGTAVILLWVDKIPRSSRVWFVRRHMHYLHPLSYVVLIGYALIILTALSFNGTELALMYGLYLATAARLATYKWERIVTFVTGPH